MRLKGMTATVALQWCAASAAMIMRSSAWLLDGDGSSNRKATRIKGQTTSSQDAEYALAPMEQRGLDRRLRARTWGIAGRQLLCRTSAPRVPAHHSHEVTDDHLLVKSIVWALAQQLPAIL